MTKLLLLPATTSQRLHFIQKLLWARSLPDTGSVRWGVTTQHAYLPKDTTSEFDTDTPIVD